MTINNVRDFFKKLAEYYKIPIDSKWSYNLWKKLKKDVNILSSGLFRTWMSRNHIPEHAIESLLSLDIPDDLKDFCKKRKKKTLSLKQHDKIGKYLQSSYDQFGKLMCFLSEYYPHKVHEKNIQNIINQLIELRSALDYQIFQEFPSLELKEKSTIYYRKSGKVTKPVKTPKSFEGIEDSEIKTLQKKYDDLKTRIEAIEKETAETSKAENIEKKAM